MKENLPISYLCNRSNTNLAKSQIGFIDFVVYPALSFMKTILPNLNISELEKNKEEFKNLVEHYDKQLGKLFLKVSSNY